MSRAVFLLLCLVVYTASYSTQPRMNTLLVSTTVDAASVNICSNLLDRYADSWQLVVSSEKSNKIYCCDDYDGNKIYLWIQHNPLLNLNFCDELFEEELNIGNDIISEVLFLSKHTAASGKASLTVHPIGIPQGLDSGGFIGRASPPSTFISSLYRAIYDEVNLKNLPFEITHEATHHGPYLNRPTCFVEIGSTESNWNDRDAGISWSDIIMKTLTARKNEKVQPKFVVCSIGGGHYVPKINDICRIGNEIAIGHMLASYTLQSFFEEGCTNPLGYQEIIGEIIQSTRVTYRDTEIIVFLDKKAFTAVNRNAIITFVNTLGINKIFHSVSDVKKLYECNVNV